MTTTTATLSPGVHTNLKLADDVAAAVTDGSKAMATNTCTVTCLSAVDTVVFRLRILQNDDNDTPTVLGSGTVTLTVVDSGSVTQLTGPAVKGAIGPTVTDYYYAVVGGNLGTFTAVTTVSAGDSDNLRYRLDAVAFATNPYVGAAQGGHPNAAGSATVQ